jgi:hypothetical protein
MKTKRMTEQEAKDYIFKEFKKFMKGQTVAVDTKGKTLYYKHDVDNFLKPEKERFFD